MLADIEERLQSQRRARSLALGAMVGVVTFVVCFAAILVLGIRVRRGTALVLGAITVGAASGTATVLERSFGKKRRFPYLDEYGA